MLNKVELPCHILYKVTNDVMKFWSSENSVIIPHSIPISSQRLSHLPENPHERIILTIRTVTGLTWRTAHWPRPVIQVYFSLHWWKDWRLCSVHMIYIHLYTQGVKSWLEETWSTSGRWDYSGRQRQRKRKGKPRLERRKMYALKEFGEANLTSFCSLPSFPHPHLHSCCIMSVTEFLTQAHTQL